LKNPVALIIEREKAGKTKMEERKMREKNVENKSYTDTALAVALVLQNILILGLLFGIVWFFHEAFYQLNPLGGLMHGGILQ
jgi:hypothetical protein